MGRRQKAPGSLLHRRLAPVAALRHALLRRRPVGREAVHPVVIRDAGGTYLASHGDGAVAEAPGNVGGRGRAPDAVSGHAQVSRDAGFRVAVGPGRFRNLRWTDFVVDEAPRYAGRFTLAPDTSPGLTVGLAAVRPRIAVPTRGVRDVERRTVALGKRTPCCK